MQTNKPLVSVIIPVYNVAPYLREALDSVLHQSYHYLEIIIIDDGSTDGSGSICDEYQSDPRITIIHQENRGVSSARNAGLDRARGEYIAFLDPDDAYHPEFIQQMLNAIENADVVECAKMKYQNTLDSRGWTTDVVKEGFYDREQALRGLIYRKFSIGVHNKLYRRELWNEIRFPEGQLCEDAEVVYSIFYLINQLYYLDQPLYLYRVRPGSASHTFSRRAAEDYMLSRNHIISFVESHTPGIFDESDQNKVLESRMSEMIGYYVTGAVDIRTMRAACEKVNLRECKLRGKVAYQMIRFCPWLLRILYPAYPPLRMMVSKVLKR